LPFPSAGVFFGVLFTPVDSFQTLSSILVTRTYNSKSLQFQSYNLATTFIVGLFPRKGRMHL
jgi:hypothetical protein